MSTNQRYGRRTASRNLRESYYVDGNTVRKEWTYEEELPQKKQVRKPAPKKYQKRRPAFGLKYTMFLIATISCVLCSSVFYLTAKHALHSSQKQISMLTEELQDIQEANAALSESLNRPIDLEEVYRIATEDFGMVYADQNQVHYYTSNGGDYIRQYESIPGRR